MDTTSIERRRAAAERLETLTDELLEESIVNLRAQARFHEIDPSTEGPPPEWVAEMGEKEAKKAFIIAREAWRPSKEVPHALKASLQVATGILKGRGERPQAQSLNIQFIQLNAPQVNYPTKKVER